MHTKDSSRLFYPQFCKINKSNVNANISLNNYVSRNDGENVIAVNIIVLNIL